MNKILLSVFFSVLYGYFVNVYKLGFDKTALVALLMILAFFVILFIFIRLTAFVGTRVFRNTNI